MTIIPLEYEFPKNYSGRVPEHEQQRAQTSCDPPEFFFTRRNYGLYSALDLEWQLRTNPETPEPDPRKALRRPQPGCHALYRAA